MIQILLTRLFDDTGKKGEVDHFTHLKKKKKKRYVNQRGCDLRIKISRYMEGQGRVAH